jgi:BON domain
VADKPRVPDRAPGSPTQPTLGADLAPEDVQSLLGEELPEDQDAVLELDELEELPETTDTERYLGEPDRPKGVDVDTINGAMAGLRDGETDDPYVASDEGLPYVPPMDPVIRPSDDEGGIEVAAGPGESALDEPYDEDHRAEDLPAEEELTARVREALEADAATSELSSGIAIATIGGVVVLRGVVDTIDDGDSLVEVASRVRGVRDVRDETEVAGL